METPKPPWKARKEHHVAAMRSASRSVCLVVAADKLHNANSILADYRRLGESLWARFNGGRDGTLWYYRAMVEALAVNGPPELVDELSRTVRQLESLAAENSPTRAT